MERILRLIHVTDQGYRKLGCKDDLQAMWEDRWTLLGHSPLLTLRGVRGLTPSAMRCRVYRTWP
jgi:hypothetical protein